MFIATDSKQIDAQGRPVVLAMGCFDGVHIGHQKVISTAVELAQQQNGTAWVFTFSPHPAKLLRPDIAPPLISAETCRIRRLKALGVAGMIEIPFTHEFAERTADDFLSELCTDLPTLAGVVCGEDWSFGKKAEGTIDSLHQYGKEHGFTAYSVQPVMDGDAKISSTTIRHAIAEGNLSVAEKLLGRPFSLFGKVVHGQKIGRELGYPTANIDPDNELLPGNGVYAAHTRVNGKCIQSAVFIGMRQTFNCNQHVIESHLLDFSEDLYDQSLEVVLYKKMRDIGPFPSREALIQQIEIDIVQIRSVLDSKVF